MKKLLGLMILVALSAFAAAGTVFQQLPSGNGVTYNSSWMPPDGTDYDTWVRDDFRLDSNAAIGDVSWYAIYLV